MRKNTFLAEDTKEQAIKKLSTIEIKMGYPDEIKEIWSKLVFEEDASYFGAMQTLGTIVIRDALDKAPKPVDRTRWLMPGHMVNACYNPSSNDITFPAAILQKPFYSLQQSVSENLGGIGAVIGHEISHDPAVIAPLLQSVLRIKTTVYLHCNVIRTLQGNEACVGFQHICTGQMLFGRFADFC